MNDVLRALARAVRSQLHPMLLVLTLAPFILGALLAWLFLLATWDPLTGLLREWMASSGWINGADEALGYFGLHLKVFLVPLIAFALYLPLAVGFSLILATAFAMPLIVKWVARRHYGDVERLHGGTWWGSFANSLWVTAVTLVGWLICLPLYLVPPLAVVIPWLWWTFAFNRILRYDALAEHASAEERRHLVAKHKGRLFALAGVMALLNWIPFAWFALPVFSGIAFAHYCLHALREARAAHPSP